MLHNESRNLLVQDFENGHSAKELAEIFSISKWSVYRLNTQKKRTGSVDLRVNERGRKSKLSASDRAAINRKIQEQPDITLKELKETLQLNACIETIRTTVISLGYRMKKKTVHASEQERPRCAGKTSRVERIRTKSGSRTTGDA